jgi:hypothetical protein
MEVFIMKNFIKNVAVFGAGYALGGLGVITVYALGLMQGDKIYEDDDVFIKSISPETDSGFQMLGRFNKHKYDGSGKEEWSNE